MSSKFRQIQKYAELLRQLLAESGLWPLDQAEAPALRVVDMGCGKGYLTFAVAALLGPKSEVMGIELRPELTQQCNDIAKSANEAEPGTLAKLTFQAGTIADAPLESVDVVIALHACDMATDEALFRGIGSKARLLVAAPCCQKELRPLLKPSAVLAAPLRHGIFRERQAEFVTDALRAELLEWAGYRSKVFEFISTEHTPKNLMIAAIRSEGGGDEKKAEGIRSFAAFYGIEHQRLADLLGFVLKEPSETLTAAS
jgi:SAM-dependent methyltransferase